MRLHILMDIITEHGTSQKILRQSMRKTVAPNKENDILSNLIDLLSHIETRKAARLVTMPTTRSTATLHTQTTHYLQDYSI